MSARKLPTSGLGRLFLEIARGGEAALPALARSFELKPSTLSSKLRALHAKGLIAFGAGRKRVVLNPHYGYLVGIDLGASHLHFALADFCGEIRRDANKKIRPEDGPHKLIAQIKEGIHKLAATQSGLGRLQGLCICVPSPVHPRTGLVSFANNLPGWKDIDLARELRQAFRVPVRVENDANAAAIGEHWRGVAAGVDCFVFVALGTGIGSGVFVAGRLHSGRTGSAGELFRVNVEWPRWQENFGDTGYFESYASGLGIAAAGRELMKSADSPEGLAAARDARFVFDAFRRGDPRARAALEKIFTILAVGIGNVISVLDPDLIVLGGGIAKGAPNFMMETVEKVVKTILPDPSPAPIRLSALEDKAQTFGAIFAALEASTHAIAQRLG